MLKSPVFRSFFTLLFLILSFRAQSQVGLEKIKSITHNDFKNELETYGLKELSSKLLYDVELYSIKYPVSYHDDTVLASGILCVPQKLKEVKPIISFQHGTIFNNSEAPSVTPDNFKELYLLSAAGYPVFIPDYIGYGSSLKICHPYYVKELSAESVIEGLKFTINKLPALGFHKQDKVILCGYSEGGYVTMATLEAIVNKKEKNLNVIGVAAGAG